MKKRVLSLFLAMALLLSMAVTATAAESAVYGLDAAGQIVAGFATLEEAISNSNGSIVTYQLNGDLDGQVISKDIQLDLNGHDLTNVTVPAGVTLYGIDSATDGYAGSFGTLSGKVQNLGVTNMTFQLNGATDVRAAAIAGQMLPDSTISNCYVTNSTLAPKDFIVGGIAACNYGGMIFNCFTYRVTVDANSRCGNLVSDCRGDLGEKDRVGTVMNCWTDATRVTGTQISPGTLHIFGANANAAGALASGEAAWSLNNSSSNGIWKQNLGTDATPSFTGEPVYKVTTCKNETIYSNTNANGHRYENGVCTVCGTACSHSYENGKCTVCGVACPGHSYENGFCTVCGDYEPAVYNEEKDVYEISNAGQLYWYARKLNMENPEIHAELTADIVIPENAPNWEPINASYAYFNGNFHTISGLKCIGGEMTYVGLFGCEGWWYEISNLHIEDSYFEGKEYVGAVVACMTNGGNVTNCYVTDTTVKDGNDTGGLVGYLGNSGMYNCYSAATVEGENAHALVGYYNSYATVENCYYLSDAETEDGGRTAAQFASGEVAYLLQGEQETHVWGQNIGTEDYPVFGGRKVLFDQETNTYYNTAATLGDLDLDGDVDAYDLTALARHVGGIEPVTGQALLNADVDGDNDVDAYDLTKHARYVGGIITEWDQE